MSASFSPGQRRAILRMLHAQLDFQLSIPPEERSVRDFVPNTKAEMIANALVIPERSWLLFTTLPLQKFLDTFSDARFLDNAAWSELVALDQVVCSVDAVLTNEWGSLRVRLHSLLDSVVTRFPIAISRKLETSEDVPSFERTLFWLLESEDDGKSFGAGRARSFEAVARWIVERGLFLQARDFADDLRGPAYSSFVWLLVRYARQSCSRWEILNGDWSDLAWAFFPVSAVEEENHDAAFRLVVDWCASAPSLPEIFQRIVACDSSSLRAAMLWMLAMHWPAFVAEQPSDADVDQLIRIAGAVAPSRSTEVEKPEAFWAMVFLARLSLALRGDTAFSRGSERAMLLERVDDVAGLFEGSTTVGRLRNDIHCDDRRYRTGA